MFCSSTTFFYNEFPKNFFLTKQCWSFILLATGETFVTIPKHRDSYKRPKVSWHLYYSTIANHQEFLHPCFQSFFLEFLQLPDRSSSLNRDFIFSRDSRSKNFLHTLVSPYAPPNNPYKLSLVADCHTFSGVLQASLKQLRCEP